MIALTSCYKCESMFDSDTLETPNLKTCEKCGTVICPRCKHCEGCEPTPEQRKAEYWEKINEKTRETVKRLGLDIKEQNDNVR